MTHRAEQPHRTGIATWAMSAAVASMLALGSLDSDVQAQQSPFTAAVTINDRAVTYYEIDQRARFLAILNAPGDLETRAREGLIEERLQLEAGARTGQIAPPRRGRGRDG